MIKINRLRPGIMIILSFIIMVSIGVFLLSLPIVQTSGQRLTLSDALFMAVSASCIIGLSVVDVANFTFFGQLVLLVLLQIGGLGFVTLATTLFAALGVRIGVGYRATMMESWNHRTSFDVLNLTKKIVCYTFAIEGIGALLLMLRFVPLYGGAKGLWFSIFHAVSAFNNAGFDLFGNSLEDFVSDWYVNLIMMALIISGGLGFVVISELVTQKRKPEEPFHFRRFSLHTQVVLIMSALLLVIGTIAYFCIEFNNPATLGQLSLSDKILAAMLQSTISRTAGFSSIPLDQLHDSSMLIMIFLMFIGGSPGSTAGGIKTTTFGIILLAVYAIIRGHEEVVVFGRRISLPTILKALAVIIISFCLIALGCIALSLAEEMNLRLLVFEVVSAFSTTGASMGASVELSVVGRLILMIIMFIGRIGPLTMAVSLAKRSKSTKVQYPEGHIMIG